MKHKRWLFLSLTSITWSWLWLVDVGKLSSSAFMGYAILLFAYALLVGLTAYITSWAWKWLKPMLAKPSWISVLKLLLVWAAVEFFIAWAVSAIWMGRSGNWDNMLPFYSLTPVIMLTPLKFLTRFLGYFGTSAVVGTGLVLIFHKQYRRYATIYWSGLLVLSLASWGMYKTPTGVDTNVTIVSEKLGEQQQIEIAQTGFVLLPEYGLDNNDSENVHNRFTETDKTVYFSGTKQVSSSSRSLNVLVYGSNKAGFLDEQNKSRLIPAGEYMPFMLEELLRTTNSAVYNDFMIRRGVVRGEHPVKPFKINDSLVFGNAACSSIINPEDYRKLTQKGSTVLTNSASLEIFRGSRLFGLYHDGFAKFMATANARPFLQSANNWKAFALDHNGNTLATVQPTGTKDVAIQTNSRKTPYTYLGEWVALLGGLFIVKELLAVKFHKRRGTHKHRPKPRTV